MYQWRCCLSKPTLECVPMCAFVGPLPSIALYFNILFLPEFNLTFLFHQRQFQTITLCAGRDSIHFMKMRFWFVICWHLSSWLLRYLSALHRQSLCGTRGHLEELRKNYHGSITSAESKRQCYFKFYTCTWKELSINKQYKLVDFMLRNRLSNCIDFGKDSAKFAQGLGCWYLWKR